MSVTALYVGVQVLYMVMMYISVYPVVITMRNSNVYEERSLGIYDEDDPAIVEQHEGAVSSFRSQDPDKGQSLRRRKTANTLSRSLSRAASFHGVGARLHHRDAEQTSRMAFIEQQIRGQLAHDLWWLVLAIMIIIVIETGHFLSDPTTYSIFNIVFECVSAYACVGMSTGVPNNDYALSGGLRKGSRVILCFVMLRGRHRGLPVAIDRAVRLPGDDVQKDEMEDLEIRRTKTMHRMMSRNYQD